MPPPSPASCRLGSSAGYTLIELLIVVAIVAVLALTALPSYRGHVLRTHRAIARVTLVDLAARMEIERLKQGRYPRDLDFHLAGREAATSGATDFSITAGGQIRTVQSESSLYNIGLDTTVTAQGTDRFRLTATAIHAQAEDRACITMSIDSTGRRLPVAGSAAGGDCWIR